MNVKLVGIDLAKHYFQVHGVDSNGKGVLKKKFTRKQFIEWLHNLQVCIVAMASCSGSQYWGKIARSLGHEVRIIPSQFVKPFLKSQKNDANDAEAIAEAASRPSMRFASLKETWQQEIQSLHRVRQRLIHNQIAPTQSVKSDPRRARNNHEYGACGFK